MKRYSNEQPPEQKGVGIKWCSSEKISDGRSVKLHITSKCCNWSRVESKAYVEDRTDTSEPSLAGGTQFSDVHRFDPWNTNPYSNQSHSRHNRTILFTNTKPSYLAPRHIIMLVALIGDGHSVTLNFFNEPSHNFSIQRPRPCSRSLSNNLWEFDLLPSSSSELSGQNDLDRVMLMWYMK